MVGLAEMYFELTLTLVTELFTNKYILLSMICFILNSYNELILCFNYKSYLNFAYLTIM